MNFAMALGCKPDIQNSAISSLPANGALAGRQGETALDSKIGASLSAQNHIVGRQSWGAAAALLGGMQTQPDVEAGASEDDSDDDENSKRAGARRKIKIEPIRDRNKRQITFNKRKSGILKKVLCQHLVACTWFWLIAILQARELHILTGAQVCGSLINPFSPNSPSASPQRAK